MWGRLENAVLALDGLEDRRLSVFAGPVLAADDPTYRDDVQLPREFWKIVAYRVNGQLRFKAFLLTQSLDGIEPVLPGPDASSTTSTPTSSRSTPRGPHHPRILKPARSSTRRRRTACLEIRAHLRD